MLLRNVMNKEDLLKYYSFYYYPVSKKFCPETVSCVNLISSAKDFCLFNKKAFVERTRSLNL